MRISNCDFITLGMTIKPDDFPQYYKYIPK